MPYTLAKALFWLILALALGVSIGWLLRSVAAHRQVARVRSQRGDAGETERLQARLAELEGVAAERDRLAAELATARSAPRPENGAANGAPVADVGDVGGADDADPDPLADAARILGQPIERDDLKVIEGIGPSVEDLCHGIGIRSWSDMATTEASLLRTMLDDAGARFKMSDPTTWPHQAALLDEGRWDDFRELVQGMRDAASTA